MQTKKQSERKEEELDGIEEIYEILKKENLNPVYLDVNEFGFSRWIKFKTKYQTCWIEWYCNVSTLRVGDRYGVRIPFNKIFVDTLSVLNKRCLRFTNTQIDKKFGLADCEIDLTLEKLDWQEKITN